MSVGKDNDIVCGKMNTEEDRRSPFVQWGIPFEIVRDDVESKELYAFAYGDGDGPWEGGQFWAYRLPSTNLVVLIKLGTIIRLKSKTDTKPH